MNENGQSPVTKADLESALQDFFKRIVEYVDGRFDGVDQRFQGIDQRFQGIDQRFQGIDQQFQGIDQQLQNVNGRFQELSDHFDERIYDTETKLLRAFREFNEAQDVRLRKLEANLGNLDTSATLRLAQLETIVHDLRARVIQLEDRPQ
jgi:hypothetical protein